VEKWRNTERRGEVMDATGEEGGARTRKGMKEAKGNGERGGREARKKRPEEWKGLGDR